MGHGRGPLPRAVAKDHGRGLLPRAVAKGRVRGPRRGPRPRAVAEGRGRGLWPRAVAEGCAMLKEVDGHYTCTLPPDGDETEEPEEPEITDGSSADSGSPREGPVNLVELGGDDEPRCIAIT